MCVIFESVLSCCFDGLCCVDMLRILWHNLREHEVFVNVRLVVLALPTSWQNTARTVSGAFSPTHDVGLHIAIALLSKYAVPSPPVVRT